MTTLLAIIGAMAMGAFISENKKYTDYKPKYMPNSHYRPKYK